MFHISIAYPVTVANWCNVGQVTIDMLHDVALLEIFDCYMEQIRDFGILTEGRGVRLCMCVKNGEVLSLVHHVAWIFDFSAWKIRR